MISVVVTTYERPDALSSVLRALARQTNRDFEIIVADDGSGQSTRDTIERWRGHSHLTIKHVWQEDRGFRPGEARNRAVLESTGRYCIFLDGDCIPRPDFVAMHRALRQPGWFVAGNRILMSRALTERVLREGLEPETWGLVTWIGHRAQSGTNRLAPMIKLPLGPLRRLHARDWRGARSANLAVWRADFDRVDGFDAAYSGWGREDSDLLVRLLRAGIRRKDGRFATGVLHLWHPEADRSTLAAADRRLDEVLSSDRIRAVAGMSAQASITGVSAQASATGISAAVAERVTAG